MGTQHEVANSQFLAEGVAEVSQETIPEGKFKPLWDKEAIAPLPTAPAKTSFGDKLIQGTVLCSPTP